MQLQNSHKYIVVVIILAIFFSNSSFINAQSIEELEENIENKKDKINELDKVINEFQGKLIETNKKASTLQNTVDSLITTEKKLVTNINKTETNIEKSNLTIKKLSLEIDDKETKIGKNTAALEQTIRNLNVIEDTPLLESVFLYDDLSDFWNTLHSLEKFQDKVQDLVVVLKNLNTELKGKKGETENEKSYLEDFKVELSGEKEAVQYTKKEKADILASTRNEEQQYQQLLAERKAAREQFERELKDLESKLQFTLDPDSIPGAGPGVLAWPLSSVRITQYFGNTAFAQAGAYSGQGHNGIDFGVPGGTKVQAALAGEVIAINTQVAHMCQYGKWALIRHPNGLTTLYAHLLTVNVSKGQSVSTGEFIGYSGETGYATGPHLHFTVYASNAVQFKEYTCNSGTTLTIPVAAYSGYLNPMNYLPKL